MGFIWGHESKYSSKLAETLSKHILLRPRSVQHIGLETSDVVDSASITCEKPMYGSAERMRLRGNICLLQAS